MSREKAFDYIHCFGESFQRPQQSHDTTLKKEITIVIKTFERPLCVAWCIVSAKTYFPNLKILVCDDGREPLYRNGSEPLPGVHWYTLPYENGHTCGAGRNFLISKVKTPYFFLTDDDVQFTSQTDLHGMLSFLREFNYDIVGGTQSPWDYGTANFVLRGKTLVEQHYAFHHVIGPGFVKCDRVSNAFLARTETVSHVKWEERLNKNIHCDFFYRAKLNGLKIAQMGRFLMTHKRKCEGCNDLINWIHGILHGHRNKSYRIEMYGGGDNEKTAYSEHLVRYRRFVLNKNNISKIKDERSILRLLKLFFTIGHPKLNLKEVACKRVSTIAFSQKILKNIVKLHLVEVSTI